MKAKKDDMVKELLANLKEAGEAIDLLNELKNLQALFAVTQNERNSVLVSIIYQLDKYAFAHDLSSCRVLLMAVPGLLKDTEEEQSEILDEIDLIEEKMELIQARQEYRIAESKTGVN